MVGQPSYLLAFAIGEFVTVEDGSHGGMPIAYLGPRGSGPMLQHTFSETKAMLEWLEKTVHRPFPKWPKYYQIALPEIGGAMEVRPGSGRPVDCGLECVADHV